ncbi:unnamed protein product [Mucor circinelloides]
MNMTKSEIVVEPAYTIISTAKDSIGIEQDANILKFINEIKGLLCFFNHQEQKFNKNRETAPIEDTPDISNLATVNYENDIIDRVVEGYNASGGAFGKSRDL